MAIQTIKFSQFADGGDLSNDKVTVGLDSNLTINTRFNNPWTFLASGTTGARPVPSLTTQNRLRFNTTLFVYEYYNSNTMTWTELSGSGTGTVNPGNMNDLVFYPANGTVVSPIVGAANSVLVTDAGKVPSLSTTLPTGLTIPGATITGSTAALTSGSIVAAPVAGTDLVNKTYADGLHTASVHSITGTTNQVIASSPTGDVTLSLPQDIATGSSPTFSDIHLSASTAHAVLLGQGASPVNSVLLGAGQVLIGTTASDPTAATLTAGSGISISSVSGSITISAVTSGMTWSIVSGTSQAALVNNGYIANNAGAVTFTLPATAAIGDEIAVEGLGAGGWILTANIGQTIKIGSSSTSSAGSLTSNVASDNVYVTCIVANTTWRVRTTNSSGLTIS